MSQLDSNIKFAKVGIVAGCLVVKDGKYLLVQESTKDIYGLWCLPAGQIDEGETIEEGAIRETREESGYDVSLVSKIGIYHESIENKVKHVFEAEIVGGDATPQEGEILDVKWFTFDEIRKLNEDGKIRAPWIWDIIQKSKKAEK
jgi:8-oxo-dGTP pyrophosphatase MutT (NUDIX family)